MRSNNGLIDGWIGVPLACASRCGRRFVRCTSPVLRHVLARLIDLGLPSHSRFCYYMVAIGAVILHEERDFSADVTILRHGSAAMAGYPGFGISEEF